MPPLCSVSSNETEARSRISSHEPEDMWSQVEIMITHIRDQDSRTKLELETTKAKLVQQSKELQQCREQILRTISAFQVNDQEILEDLVMIRESLRNWILVLPDIKGFRHSWQRAHSDMMEMNLAPPPEIGLWREWPLDLVETDIMFLEIFYIIWKRLIRPQLAGATADQEFFLGKLLTHVKLLKPPKDSKAIRAWRSDTYRAFTETSHYQQQLSQCCENTVIIIRKYVRAFSFSENIEWGATLLRLFKHVVKPAATLGTKLNCSPDDYSWNWGFYPHPDVEKSDTEELDLIDCKTGGLVSKATIQSIQAGSKVGELIMPVFPELCRHAETTKVTIQRPMVLASFTDVSLNPNLRCEVRIPISPHVRKTPEDVNIKHEDPRV